MSFKKHIPNLLTLGNLFCGTVATIFAVKELLVTAGLFVVIGILFDFCALKKKDYANRKHSCTNGKYFSHH